MAYVQKNLSALSYANGFTLWHYRTPDSASDVLGAGYFDEAVRMFRAGDMVIVNAGVGSIAVNGAAFVASNTGATVTLRPMAVLGAPAGDA